ISVVALFGAPYATAYRFSSQMRLRLETEWARVSRHIRALASLSGKQRRAYVMQKLRLLIPSNGDEGIESNIEYRISNISSEVLAQRVRVQRATFAALARYTPRYFPGRLVLFLPCKTWVHSSRRPLRWRSVAERVEE